MTDKEKELLVKKLIECPTIKKMYYNQSWYYKEYIWDDWDYYMFWVYAEHIELYISWKLDNKNKDFHKWLIDLIIKK